MFSAAIVLFVASAAHAQTVQPSGRVLTDGARPPGEAAAQEHFQRALLWYRAGKYRLAIEELDAALDRDPGGKDLVFNLALVQEKLGDLDGAIRSLQRFQTMEKDPLEIERANQTIQRLEGARAELVSVEPHAQPRLPICPEARHRGRLDGWVIGTGGLAVASLLVGVAFAVRTLTLGPSGDAADQGTRSQATRAHNSAVMADLALSTSLLAGAASAALYWGRDADGAPQHAAQPLHLPRMSAAWLELRY